MKRCPRCGQIYSDELLFCLQDGSELLDQFDEQETPTVVRRPRDQAPSYLKYLAIALVLLLVIGFAGAIGAYIVWNKLAGGGTTHQSPTPSQTPATRISPTPNPSPTARETPVNVNGPPRNTNSRPSENETDFVDPGTTRITFRRGGVGETVNGWVNQKRRFVLRTLEGQNLAAETSSELGCVVFDDGSTRTEFITEQGDTRISIRNNCPAPVRFRLSVTVR